MMPNILTWKITSYNVKMSLVYLAKFYLSEIKMHSFIKHFRFSIDGVYNGRNTVRYRYDDFNELFQRPYLDLFSFLYYCFNKH